MTRIVVWDVLGTLVQDPYDQVPGWLGLSPEQLFEVKDPEAWHAFERGAIDEADYVARFFRDRRAWDSEALFARIRGAYAWRPGAVALLEELAGSGVEMHACSNYSRWYRWIEEQLGLSRYLPWSFVSCLSGWRKPEPQVYEHMLQDLRVAPAGVLFVDDQLANRQAAEALGIDSFDPADLPGLRDALLGALGLQ